MQGPKKRKTSPSSAEATGASARPLGGRLSEFIGREGLQVGDRLPNIRVLADRLGIKASEVRDGLLQAQAMGLVRIQPRSGVFVESPTYATLVDTVSATLHPSLLKPDYNLLQLLDARRFLEVELAGRAAEHRRMDDLLPVQAALNQMASIPQVRRRQDYVEADIAFHTEIARLAGNSLLLNFQQTTLQLLKVHLEQLPWTRSRRQRTDRSHAAIYDALVAGSPRQARSAMHEHLTLAYDNLLSELKRSK